MVRILTRADYPQNQNLFHEMFRARASVFHDRLGWDVDVRDGMEIDRYDEVEDPVYLVAIDASGRLSGSLRLLPTTSATMLRNEFSSFFDEPVDISSPNAWECTRFCVHPRPSETAEANRAISAELLIGLCEIALDAGINHIVGLYDAVMTRVYRRIGWSPAPLAFSKTDVGNLVVGIWEVSQEAVQNMRDHESRVKGRIAENAQRNYSYAAQQ